MKALITLLLLSGAASGPVLAGNCQGDSVAARALPRVIGRPYSTLRTPYRMPCDTMIVPIGDTCTIYPGTMMHFGSTSKQANRIHVLGRLEVLGSEEAPVTFSGTLSDGDFGLKPGTGNWGGFLVDGVGEISMRNARIFKASPIMNSQSDRVSFSKVLLKQSLDLVGPNGRYFPVDFKETKIDTLDFSVSTSTVEPQTQAKDSSSVPAVASSRSGRLAWSLIGGGAVLVGGGLWWYMNNHETGSSKNPTDEVHYPARPGFPQSGP